MSKSVPEAGDAVGPYRLIEQIGSGGMASVYRAVRQDMPERTVAVKVLNERWANHGALIERFRAEQEILAGLDHPGIARLLDGGVTAEGVHYVVMEFVEGVTLDEYSKVLDIRGRLQLFLQLCEAVEYAHKRLVVHRDLKPENVLITTSGAVKLLDFGIAKLLRPHVWPGASPVTRVNDRLATPEYASPEQLRGEAVSTATDVYGLGMLLYVLLSRRLPFPILKRDWAEIERVVCNQDPLPLPRIVHADIQAIVRMALRKDPADRYPSAAAMASDIRRHLEHRPVRARRGTGLYSARLFVRRNRVAVGLAATLALVLAGGAAWLWTMSREVMAERDTARATSYFLEELFGTADPTSARRSMRDVLDDAAGRIDKQLAAHPRAQAAMAEKIGDVYRQLALYDKARPLAELAMRRYEELDGPWSTDAARNMIRVADLYRESQQYPRAEALCRRSLQIRRRMTGDKHKDVADSLNLLGIVCQYQGKMTEAVAAFREAVEIRRVADPGSTLLALSLGNLGNVLRDQGDWPAAESLFREALGLRRQAWGPEHPRIAFSLSQLSQMAYLRGHAPEALATGEESVRMLRRTVPERHPDVARGLQHYGNALRLAGRYADAEAALREGWAIARERRGADTPETVAIGAALGLVLDDTGRSREAEPLLRKNVETRRLYLGPRSTLLAAALEELARNRMLLGDKSEARLLLGEALTIRQSAQGRNHHETARVAGSLTQIATR